MKEKPVQYTLCVAIIHESIIVCKKPKSKKPLAAWKAGRTVEWPMVIRGSLIFMYNISITE